VRPAARIITTDFRAEAASCSAVLGLSSAARRDDGRRRQRAGRRRRGERMRELRWVVV